MEDPKTSQASSSDTLRLGRNRGPIWYPKISTPISPQFRGYPFPRAQARRTQLGLSKYRSHLPFPSTPYRLGAVGPKIGQKWGQL